eukprot:jgi/Botrbrau1/14651/Bobra.0108s0012.1
MPMGILWSMDVLGMPMGWGGVGCDVVGWDGMDVVGCGGVGWGGMGWDVVGWGGVGWDGIGWGGVGWDAHMGSDCRPRLQSLAGPYMHMGVMYLNGGESIIILYAPTLLQNIV